MKSRILKIGLAATTLLIFNSALYKIAPALFEADFARGPYAKANNLELTRVYHSAIPIYENIIRDYPSSKYAILSKLGIANSQLGLGQQQSAIEMYNEILLLISTSSDQLNIRYSVIEKLLTIYRDTGKTREFHQAALLIQEEYPGSKAALDAQAYMESLEAASAMGTAVASNKQIQIEPASLKYPDKLKVGEKATISFMISGQNLKTTNFSVATNLDFWQSFKLVSVKPPTIVTNEYWGKRLWQYDAGSLPLEIEITIEGKKAGRVNLDLDAETDFQLIELGLTHTFEVEN